jgi:hypothetical protein
MKFRYPHRIYSGFWENPDNCSGFGFYIHNMHLHFLKQIVISIHGGIMKLIPSKKKKKKNEDGGTSNLVSGQGECAMGTVPALWYLRFPPPSPHSDSNPRERD